MQSSIRKHVIKDKLLKKRSTMMIITRITLMKILLMNINIQLLAKMKTIKSIKIQKDKQEEDASLTEKIKE